MENKKNNAKQIFWGFVIALVIYIMINARFTSKGESLENEIIYLGRQLDVIEEKVDKIAKKLHAD